MSIMRKTFELLVQYIGIIGIALAVSLYGSFLSYSYSTGSKLGEKSKVQADALEWARYSAYNGGTSSGAQVISAARRFSTGYGFYIYINDGTTTRGVNITGSSSSCPTPDLAGGKVSASNTFTCNYFISDLTDENSLVHVKSSSAYSSSILLDPSGVVAGLGFILK